MAKLIVESGGDRREYTLPDPCRIGRDAENDIVLNDGGASRRHCRIAQDGGHWILEDLHSANGTFKNEERIDRTRLADGDVVRIGASTLRFSSSGAASAVDAGGGDELEISLEDPGSGGAGTGGWILIGVTGEVRGKRFELSGARLTLGRKNTNTVALVDTKVSGVHCEVVFEGGKPVLRDLGSTNGTFLEGKRIDEIALSHGDRFGVGECVFVVADKAEPEPELERRDDESERTIIEGPDFRKPARPASAKAGATAADGMDELLKADLSAVKSGSSALQFIVLLLFVGGIGGAGWYYMQMKSKAAGVGRVVPAADNLLGERWSFESTDEAPAPSSAWNLAADDAEGFSTAVAKAKSGEGSLRAQFTSGAVAELRETLTAAQRRYEFSGFARTSGEATASLVAEFTRSDDPSYRLRSVVASGQSAAFAKLAGSVVPPSDADGFTLKLVGAGNGGEVVFDDLSITAGSNERPSPQAAGAFEVETFGDNVLYRRNGETLIRALPILITGAENKRFDGGLFRAGDSILCGPAGAYKVTDQVAPTAKKITQTIAVSGDASRVSSIQLPFQLRGALLEHDVNVLSSARGLEPYRDSFELDGVMALVVGKGATRMRITLTPAVHVKANRDEKRFELLLSIPTGTPQLKIETQIDFVDEVVDAAKAKEAAEQSFKHGALGDTLAQLKAIRDTYAFDENALAAAEQIRQSVEVEIEKQKKSVTAAAARARYLKSESSYVEALTMASDAAKRLKGTEGAALVEAEIGRLKTEADVLLAERRKTDGERLLSRIKTAVAQNPPKQLVAKAIGDYLQNYANPDIAAAAKTLLEKK